jgi:hypothetical protein
MPVPHLPASVARTRRSAPAPAPPLSTHTHLQLTPAQIEERSAAYERAIADLESALAKAHPNMKAGAQLEEVEARLKEQTCVMMMWR